MKLLCPAGIISCMDFNPDRGGMMAVGAYSGTAALYDSRTRETLFLLQGQAGGLTQVCNTEIMKTVVIINAEIIRIIIMTVLN